MSIKWPKIFLFGDSQVQRSFEIENGVWSALLANYFQRICDIIPRGFSGYTSRSGRCIKSHIFSPSILSDTKGFVIWFGTNDYSGKDETPCYVPVEEYIENLEDIITYLQTIGLSKEKIIVVTPGPYNHGKFMKFCAEIGRTFPKRDNDTAFKYATACTEMAQKLGINVINMYEEIMKHEDWSEFLLDGLHLSRQGSKLLYDLLLPLIKDRIDASQLLLPYWREINPLHPSNVTLETCIKTCPNAYK